MVKDFSMANLGQSVFMCFTGSLQSVGYYDITAMSASCSDIIRTVVE